MSEIASLTAMQAWLQDAVIAPRGPASLDPLAGTATFPAAAGLAIYRRAYIARITAAMRVQFPALCQALGATLFDDFAAEYLRLHPPQSYTLHDLGRRFAAFLEEQRPDREPPDRREVWIDFLIDLARFERAVFELFDAPGVEGMAPAARDATDDRLRLQPAVRLERFAFDVAHYYHAVRRAETPPPPPRAVQRVALVRTDYVVRTITLLPWEYTFLTAMAGGGSMRDGIAAVAAARGMSEDAAIAAWHDDPRIRNRWIDLGLFTAI